MRKEMQVVTEANLQRICLQVTLCRESKHYGAGIALGSTKRYQSCVALQSFALSPNERSLPQHKQKPCEFFMHICEAVWFLFVRR